jgi:hypothetical protein
MTCFTVAFGLAMMLGLAGADAGLAQNRADNCAPEYRRDPVATSRAREAKKDELRRRGFPERLLQLFDRYQCVACIENASAEFHITVQYHDDDRAPTGPRGGRLKIRGYKWDPVTERGARDDLAAGRIKAFYILNTASRCRCCPDDPHLSDEDYRDWSRELDMHMGQAIAFDDPRRLGPLPPDLENPPRNWLERVPDIQRYQKPARRVVQVLCRTCQPIADRWNAAAGEMDALWDSKVDLLDGLSTTRSTLAANRNEIVRLRYRQLFDATKSDANLRRIDELTKMNEEMEAGLERDDRRLAEIERSIAEQQQRMDAILKELQDCEATCKTAALTTDAQTAVAPLPTEQSAPPEQPQQSVPPSEPEVQQSVAPEQPEEQQSSPPPDSAKAACADCASAQADMERFGQLRAERMAELEREQGDHDADMANLENLRHLRAFAEGRRDAAKVADIDRRMAELTASAKATRARMFKLQEDIQDLSEKYDSAKRQLLSCNRACAGATVANDGVDGTVGAPKRTVAVKPLTAVARCQDCMSLLVQLQQSYRELEVLAQDANGRQKEEDFEKFEEQRAKVADYEQQLAKCNNSCATTTTADTTGTSGSLDTQAPPVPPPGVAACPECEAAVAAAARISAVIRQRTAEIDRLRAEHDVNTTNLNNLYELRALAAGSPVTAVTVANLDRRIAALKEESQGLRTRVFELEEQIRQLDDELDAAKRALDACNQKCAGSTGATDRSGLGLIGDGNPHRTVVVKPLSASARCATCQSLLVQLQQSHATLEQLAQSANRTQDHGEFEKFEEQRAKVADYERDLAACNQRCATTVAENPVASTPAIPAPPASLPAAAPVTGVPSAPVTTATSPGPAARRVCSQCELSADRVTSAEVSLAEARAEVTRLEEAGRKLQAELSMAKDQAAVHIISGNIAPNNAALNSARRRVSEQLAQLEEARAELAACIKGCTPAPSGMTPSLNAVYVADPTRPARCPACQDIASKLADYQGELKKLVTPEEAEMLLPILRSEKARLEEAAKLVRSRIRAGGGPEFEAGLQRIGEQLQRATAREALINEELRIRDRITKEIETLVPQLDACNERCSTAAGFEAPVGCVGMACEASWQSCLTNGACLPIDKDCGVPGTCGPGTTGKGAPPLVNVFDPSLWGTSGNVDIAIGIQKKMTDVLLPPTTGKLDWWSTNLTSGYVDLPSTPQEQASDWFNPLGLLARRLVDQIERWRGSVGPRPLLTRRDIELAEPYTSGQAMGLPKGVHLLLTDRGGSTGRTLALQVLNLTGKPVRLAPMPMAIEPIRQQAQARVQQAFGRLAKAAPARLELSAYCLEFVKLPPGANQIFRLAPASVQQQYESMSKVLRSAYRVQQAGLLRPDSNPAAYTDSIKQWAVWAVEQRLNESRFTEAFLGHTKKNVEAAGQPWSKPAEDMIRKVSPNRWRDILKVLQGAGLPVPQ